MERKLTRISANKKREALTSDDEK